jgi:hypothetical protein
MEVPLADARRHGLRLGLLNAPLPLFVELKFSLLQVLKSQIIS